jgi:hypothetical protein
MEARTYLLDTIKYKRKEIDKGIILGERPFRWTLKKKYNPCFAKSLVNGEYVSYLSPHKRNFKVYIPICLLQPGRDILIYKKDHEQELMTFVIHVVNVDGNKITLIKKEA